jgi:apolipoprotein N-acyltransferase
MYRDTIEPLGCSEARGSFCAPVEAGVCVCQGRLVRPCDGRCLSQAECTAGQAGRGTNGTRLDQFVAPSSQRIRWRRQTAARSEPRRVILFAMKRRHSQARPKLQAHGIDSVRWHLILAMATAVPLALAFPRPGVGWLAHLALVPMGVLALRSRRTWRLAWSSFVVSMGWWLVMLYWLIPVTPPGYVALCALMAVYTPGFVLTFRVLVRRWHIPGVLALPMAWVSFEFVRGIAPAGGFSWFALGHSQAAFTVDQAAGRLVQIADLFGEHGVSFLVAMTNGLLVGLLVRPLVSQMNTGRRTRLPMSGPLLLWLVSMVAAWCYGQWRINSIDVVGSINVAVVQTNVPQSVKDSGESESMDQVWKGMLDQVIAINDVATKPDLIVCPETMVPAALNAEALEYYRTATAGGRGFETYERQLRDLSRHLKTYLMIGASARYDWQKTLIADGDGKQHAVMIPRRRYNSAYLLPPAASATDRKLVRYDKIHRVPFGEYVPWVGAWPWLKRQFIHYLTPYDFDYSLTAGATYTAFEIDLGDALPPVRAATPICFEDTVARLVRKLVYGAKGVKRVDLLVNLTNDGWFAGSAQGPQHLQIATLRCIELRVPMARSVNTGVSGLIDSTGRVVAVVAIDGRSQLVQGSASANLNIDARTTFFGRYGSLPIVVMTCFTATLVVLSFVRSAIRSNRSRST